MPAPVMMHHRPSGRMLWLRRGLRYVLAPVGLALAYWQYRRLQWKTQLLEDLAQMNNGHPEPLPSSTSEMQFYRPYIVRSVKVDWERCLRIGPYPLFGEDKSEKVHFGHAVVCPMCTRGQHYLLDFGMLANPDIASHGACEEVTASNCVAEEDCRAIEQQIVAVRERTHASAWAWGNVPSEGQWRVKDIQQLSSHLGTEAVMLQILQPELPSFATSPLADPENVCRLIPNRHQEYVLTWLGLTLTAIAFSFLV
jgi:cytochrome oxidase assembly protein ShyY1